MRRPDEHVIDSQADAIFREAFSDWAVTPVDEDYGWDHIVEIFRNGQSTGLLFGAQLKGSRHTAYSSDRSFISQTISRDAAEYLGRQLEPASPKTLYCTRHGYFARGKALDDIDAEFKVRYCKSCADISPRPSDWNFYRH